MISQYPKRDHKHPVYCDADGSSCRPTEEGYQDDPDIQRINLKQGQISLFQSHGFGADNTRPNTHLVAVTIRMTR